MKIAYSFFSHAIINNSAINILVHHSWSKSGHFSVGYMPKNCFRELLCGKYMLILVSPNIIKLFPLQGTVILVS